MDYAKMNEGTEVEDGEAERLLLREIIRSMTVPARNKIIKRLEANRSMIAHSTHPAHSHYDDKLGMCATMERLCNIYNR